MRREIVGSPKNFRSEIYFYQGKKQKKGKKEEDSSIQKIFCWASRKIDLIESESILIPALLFYRITRRHQYESRLRSGASVAAAFRPRE